MANSKPRITLGLPDHPRCRALIDGKVGIEGYTLDIDPNFVSSGERHYKYLHGRVGRGRMLGGKPFARNRKGATASQRSVCVCFGENEKQTMRALNRYQIEQGLMKTELPIEDLFVGHV